MPPHLHSVRQPMSGRLRQLKMLHHHHHLITGPCRQQYVLGAVKRSPHIEHTPMATQLLRKAVKNLSRPCFTRATRSYNSCPHVMTLSNSLGTAVVAATARWVIARLNSLCPVLNTQRHRLCDRPDCPRATFTNTCRKQHLTTRYRLQKRRRPRSPVQQQLQRLRLRH